MAIIRLSNVGCSYRNVQRVGVKGQRLIQVDSQLQTVINERERREAFPTTWSAAVAMAVAVAVAVVFPRVRPGALSPQPAGRTKAIVSSAG